MVNFWAIGISVTVGIAVLVALIVVKTGAFSTEPFSTYDYVDENYKCLKEGYQLGQPSGVLAHLADQASCDTPFNLLVQPDVAFRPSRRGDGCTYVELRYPG